MPPKPKSKGKTLKVQINPKTSNNVENEINNPSTESLEQFQLELCWCIQQLQSALSSGKLNQRQVQENTKALNTLMSNSSSFIKKRQVMRLTFGDYRAKMMEENKKNSKGLNMKITSSSPNKKSQFIRKAFSSGSENNFRFNFNIEKTEDSLVQNISKVDISENRIVPDNIHPSQKYSSLQLK